MLICAGGRELAGDWGKEVDQHSVGGVADRLFLVGLGDQGLVLLRRTLTIWISALGDRVVGRPGVIGGGMEHAERTGGDGRARLPGVRPDHAEQLLVPPEDRTVAVAGRFRRTAPGGTLVDVEGVGCP